MSKHKLGVYRVWYGVFHVLRVMYVYWCIACHVRVLGVCMCGIVCGVFCSVSCAYCVCVRGCACIFLCICVFSVFLCLCFVCVFGCFVCVFCLVLDTARVGWGDMIVTFTSNNTT